MNEEEKDIEKTVVDGPAAPAGLKKLAVLLIAGTALALLIRFTPLGDAMQELKMARYRHGGTGIAYELRFFALASLLIAMGVPRLLLTGLAGMMFGFTQGVIVALAASVAGSYAFFSLIRWSGGDWVRHRLENMRWFRKISTGAPSTWAVCLIRQLPVSNLLINGGLALSRTTNVAFLTGSLLGFLPQGVIATLIGSGAGKGAAWQGMVQLGGAALALGIGGLWWWRKSKKAGVKSAE